MLWVSDKVGRGGIVTQVQADIIKISYRKARGKSKQARELILLVIVDHFTRYHLPPLPMDA